MSEPRSVEDRVAKLETAVERLESAVKRLTDRLAMLRTDSSAGSTTRGRPPLANRRDLPGDVSPTARSRPKPKTRFASVSAKATAGPRRDSIWWLSRIGTVLLLVGVVYLYKYAVDQGWLSPTVRIGFGLVLGTGLVVLGMRLHASLRWYARALLVGGIITFFITTYAAFHWYDLVSQTTAIGFLALVSVAAFGIAIRLDDVAVGVTTVIGALINPILLYESPASIPGLTGYTSAAVTVLGGVFLLKGWRSFLWTGFYLTWGILLVAALNAMNGEQADRVWTQVAIGVSVVVFWFAPLVRERLIILNPTKWRRPPQLSALKDAPYAERHAHVISLFTPLAALLLTATAWDLSRRDAGLVALAGVLIAAAAGAIVDRWKTGDRLAFSQGVTSVALLTIAVGLILEGNALLLAFTVEAAALHAIGMRMDDEIPLRAGQAMLAAVAFWVFGRFFVLPTGDPPILNADALVNALPIAVTAALAPRLASTEETTGYRLAAHILLLGWLARELWGLPNGGGIVTLAWGIYGIGLLVHALTQRQLGVQRVAMATLLLVVGKLFLIDLAELAPVWRILLFMGFGGLFLMLSYYFKDAWAVDRAANDERTTREGDT